MEAHRRWILADAERGRKTKPTTTAPPGPATSPTPQPTPELAPAPALVPEPEPEAEPEPKPKPETGPKSKPGPEREPKPKPEPKPETRQQQSGPDPGPGPGPATASPPPSLSRRRRALVLAAAAAVTAVLGIGTAVLTNHNADDSADSGAASGKHRHNAGPTTSAGNGQGPASRGAQGEDPAVPLTARTRPYAYDDGYLQTFLVNRSADEVPQRPAPQNAPGWGGDLGAVAAGSQNIEVTVQGTGKDTVVLRGMNVRVQSTGEPLSWNNFRLGTGCGGTAPPKSFAVGLDDAAPRTRPRAGRRDFPYTVSESDSEVFRITADTQLHDVRWYLELEWSSGARHDVLRVDDQGKPLRTSGGKGRPTYSWSGPLKWVREQQDD
ncbi:hypothetical protein [Streptomyces aureocirculatus]|uniref:hypothetical protein n=1 Tax=Streptomyces aureocirculatus TaxID=67275 RepID=UPI00068EC1F8|nr:hypothetical protein [Streptomyces aureocirculatus]